MASSLAVAVAMFTLADGALFKPLPYATPSRLVLLLGGDSDPAHRFAVVSRVDYEMLRHEHRGISGIASFDQGPPDSLSLPTGKVAIHVATMSVGALEVLGVRPAIGRGFIPTDANNQSRVGLLTYSAWRRFFGQSPDIVSRVVPFDGGGLTIIGVLPKEFIFPFVGPRLDDVDVVVPAPDTFDPTLGKTDGVWAPVARLADGISRDQAEAETNTLLAHVSGVGLRRDRKIRAVALRDGLFRQSAAELWTLVSAAIVVVGIASLNMSAMLLSLALSREREFAIRAALGATRWRLIRRITIESALFGLGAGAIGLVAIAASARVVFGAIPQGHYRLPPSGLDARSVLYAIGLSLATGVIYGLGPAFRLSCPRLSAVSQSARSVSQSSSVRTGRLLIAAQVALGVVLVVMAATIGHRLIQLYSAPLGIDPRGVLQISIQLPVDRYPSVPQRFQLSREVLRRITELPNVVAAGGIDGSPVGGRAAPRGLPAPAPREAGLWSVTGGYFATVGMRVVEGRVFSMTEETGDAPVTIVSASLANRLWPGRSALGMLLSDGSVERLVIGVVGDWRARYDDPPLMAAFRPLSDKQFRFMVILAKTERDRHELATLMAREARKLDPDLLVAPARSLTEVLERAVAGIRFRTMLFGSFGVLAWGILLLGIYCHVNEWMIQRIPEIGLRLALGASARQVGWHVVRRVVAPVVGGSGVAMLILILGLAKSGEQLAVTTPYDPVAWCIGIVSVLIVAAAAAFVPALRATSIDPVSLLRHE
jgi:predicted permease